MSAHVGDGRLLRYALDELDGVERLRVDAHLASCPDCRARVSAEQRLDEGIIASAASTPPGGAARSLEGLWRALDGGAERAGHPAGAAPADRSSAARRRVPRPAVLVGALVVATLLVGLEALRRLPSAPPPEPARLHEVSSPGEAPAAPAPPVDHARLAAARARVGRILVEADARFPFLTAAFADDCELGLRPLRRDGWPVSSLVRRLALGEDDIVAAAALRHAAGDPATLAILAAGLEVPGRAAVVLDLVAREGVELDRSAVLVRALERAVADRDEDEGLASEAWALLGRAGGARSRGAVERLLDRAWTGAARSGGQRAEPTAAERDFLWLAARAPAALALPRLLAAARRERLRPACARHFAEHAASAPQEAARAVTRVLDDETLRPLALAWTRQLQLEEATGGLLAALEETLDEEVLETLVAFGGPEVAGELFLLWADHRHGSRGQVLLDALRRVLAAEPGLPAALGARVRGGRVEDLVALSRELPAALRGRPLLGCLAAWPQDDEADRQGFRAGLVVALGQVGHATDGRRLLAWIARRPADDPLLPLAWAAAGRLAATEAVAAWQHAGSDPRVLSEVAAATAPRFDLATRPSTGMLAPLRAALRRHPIPSASTEELP